MDKIAILALIDAIINNKLDSQNIRGARGPRGFPGKNGEDFDFESHKIEILELVRKSIVENKELFRLTDQEKRELKLNFSDLSDEDLKSIRGPRGPKGQKGKDGADFDFEEHKDKVYNQVLGFIDNQIDKLKLKFSDLSDEDVESLKGGRGPRGQKGKQGEPGLDGKSAYEIWSENNEGTEEEFLELLRGPRGMRGQKGKPGQDGKSAFDLWAEDNEGTQLDFLATLKGDQGEKGDTGEKGEDGERGPRGQRGKPGVPGLSAYQLWLEDNDGSEEDYKASLIGERGPRGVAGPIGAKGERGERGFQGRDGQDAPVVTNIDLRKSGRDKFYMAFQFSDGTEITTNIISLPLLHNIYYSVMGGGGSGSGGGGLSEIPVLLDGVLVGNAQSLNFSNATVEVDGTDPTQINITPETKLTLYEESVEVGDSFDEIDFCGDNITVSSSTVISDWPSLDVVTTMAGFGGNPRRAKVVVTSDAQRLSKTFVAGEAIAVNKFVRIGAGQECFIATNNGTFSDAKVRGIALNAGAIGENIEVLLFGLLEDPAFNFILNDPFFLGTNGDAVQTPPVTVGEFVVELGESLGTGAIFTDLKTPVEIL